MNLLDTAHFPEPCISINYQSKRKVIEFPNENDEDDFKIHLQGETLRSTQIAPEHHKVFPDSRDEDVDMLLLMSTFTITLCME